MMADMADAMEEIRDMYVLALTEAGERRRAMDADSQTSGKVRESLREIIDEAGVNYGMGVYLDSTFLTGLSEEDRAEMVKEYVVTELAGETFVGHDSNGEPVIITLAKKDDTFRDRHGRKRIVLSELYEKFSKNPIRQEAIVLIDELIETANYSHHEASKHPHGWIDNNGKNGFDLWNVYLQETDNTVWEMTLNIGNTSNGDKILYDISQIKKVAGRGKSRPTTTLAETSDESVASTDNSIPQTASDVNPDSENISGKRYSDRKDADAASKERVDAFQEALKRSGIEIDEDGNIISNDSKGERAVPENAPKRKPVRAGKRFDTYRVLADFLDGHLTQASDRKWLDKLNRALESAVANEQEYTFLKKYKADIGRLAGFSRKIKIYREIRQEIFTNHCFFFDFVIYYF